MFGLFGGSKRKAKKRRTRRLPERKLAPVEEIAEQGILVAEVAVRMTVKNEIIMNALKANVDYDQAEIMEFTRKAVLDLVAEREQDAKHIEDMLSEIRASGFSASSESEYSNEDSRTLRHRRDVYERVAQELRDRSENEAFLRATADRARELAWGEIGDSLKDRAMHPYYSGGATADYREHRDERIALFIEKDLTELILDQMSSSTNPRSKWRRTAKAGE